MATFDEEIGEWVCTCGKSWWVQDWRVECDVQLDDEGDVVDQTDFSFREALGPIRCGKCGTAFTVGEVENE
jgi:hypothetical protein